MERIKIFFKRVAAAKIAAFIFLYGRLLRRPRKNFQSVGILFLPVLGIGDLTMLSPAIQKIKEIFSNADVYLISKIPACLSFSGIKLINPAEAKNKKFDLVISPTMNLRHLPWLFRAPYFAGFFASPKLVSNFALLRPSYHPGRGHYLERGLKLVAALDASVGQAFKAEFDSAQVAYPQPIFSIPAVFDSGLKNFRYAVLGVFSKYKDRSWPLENVAAIIRHALSSGYIEKIAILGDKSESDQHKARILAEFSDIEPSSFINLAGQTTLPETSFILKNAVFYFGFDSGPSHLAYLSCPRALALFITVKPENRLPLFPNRQKIATLYPPGLSRQFYTGWGPPDYRKVIPFINKITAEDVVKKLDELMK